MGRVGEVGLGRSLKSVASRLCRLGLTEGGPPPPSRLAVRAAKAGRPKKRPPAKPGDGYAPGSMRALTRRVNGKNIDAPIAFTETGTAEVWALDGSGWRLATSRAKMALPKARVLRGARRVLVWRSDRLMEPLVSAADPDLLDRFNRDRPDQAQPAF